MAHYSEIGTPADYAAVANQGLAPTAEAVGSRVPSRNPAGSLSWKVKSAMDCLGALVLLLAIAPLMAVVALAVRLDSPGPVFFRQPRFGAGRSVIVVTKFRTMRSEGTDLGGRRQASRDDARVTRIGRFLRKTCLDELPQIWDVLCGRMSLVGPRPHPLALEVDGQPIEALIPNYHLRHRVRPGITGLAQINGNRGPVETVAMGRERVHYDLEYIESHSIWLDLRILFKTLAVPFQKNGSY
jgi:lipopolysaccharide/colanic/teichoic acid biosynthesis glycosyltransferase